VLVNFAYHAGDGGLFVVGGHDDEQGTGHNSATLRALMP
jgi:hypothetical protein